MDKVTHGFDRGLPPRAVEHLYSLDSALGVLRHFTDGQLRATVELQHAHQFVADHPEAADVVRELVPDVDTRAAEYKVARAKEHAAIRSKPAGLPNQADIDAIVQKHVAAALERFQAEMAKQLAAAQQRSQA